MSVKVFEEGFQVGWKMIGSIGPAIVYLVYASTCSTVYCDIQRFDDGTFIADFSVINKGQMQHPSIVMFLEDLTLMECTEFCIKHLDCVTFNYNLETHACELVDQNFDEYESLDVDPNWYNYGTPDKINGGWSNWTSSPCSVDCGNGTLTQYRACTAPEPKYGGAPCIGNKVQTVRCEMKPCKPINGGLSNDWVNNTECSVTCGGGTLKQIKTCTNPVPQYGGKDCATKPTQTVTCNPQKCPCQRTVNGTCCAFPFKFKGNYYDTCVYTHGKYVCVLDNKSSTAPFQVCAQPPN